MEENSYEGEQTKGFVRIDVVKFVQVDDVTKEKEPQKHARIVEAYCLIVIVSSAPMCAIEVIIPCHPLSLKKSVRYVVTYLRQGVNRPNAKSIEGLNIIYASFVAWIAEERRLVTSMSIYGEGCSPNFDINQ